MIENEKIEEMMFELDEKCENSLTALERDYGAIRTGRANPHILDRLEVEAYGGMSKLIELGNVSVLDAKCLQISVWDKSLLKAVEKAILQSNIGITPTNDGNVIRLVFPALTEERRKELVKQVKKMKTAKELSEDEVSACEADVEKAISGYMSTLESIISAKEKELMSI